MRLQTYARFSWSVGRGLLGLCWRELFLAAAAVPLLVALVGCQKATKPKPVKYNIYLGASYSTDPYDDNTQVNQLYVYDADSLTQRDSISLPASAAGMAVTPDGRWLFLSTGPISPRGPRSITKVDALTHEISWLSPGPASGVTMLKRGERILNGLRLLRASDGATIRQYDDSLTPDGGSSSGTKVAAIVRSRVRILDVETGKMVGDYGPNLGTGGDCPVIRALLHPDEQRVLVIALDSSSYTLWFIAGNVLTGETLFWDRIYSTQGQLAISADGTIGVCADAGHPPMWETPIGVDVVDLTSMTLMRRFDQRSGIPGRACGQVCFLPSDREIVLTPISGWEPGPMCVIDLRTLTVVDTVLQTFTYVTKRALGIGPRPQ